MRKERKEDEYELFLTPRGKSVYQGGNIEVLRPVLSKTFSAKNERAAYHKFHYQIASSIGSANTELFGFKKRNMK